MAKTVSITTKNNVAEIVLDGNKINDVISYELSESANSSILKLEIDINGSIEVSKKANRPVELLRGASSIIRSLSGGAMEAPKWRRFELTTEDPELLEELMCLARRPELTNRDLALIALTLRVQSGFSLEDFDT